MFSCEWTSNGELANVFFHANFPLYGMFVCLHPGQILLAVESGIDVFDGVYPH